MSSVYAKALGMGSVTTGQPAADGYQPTQPTTSGNASRVTFADVSASGICADQMPVPPDSSK
jgi:hypothetical protein